jgi:competence protein ComEC
MGVRGVVAVVLVVTLAGCGGVSTAPTTDAPTKTPPDATNATSDSVATQNTSVETATNGTGAGTTDEQDGNDASDDGDTSAEGGATSDSDGGDESDTTTGERNATNGTLTVHFINVGQSESILAIGPTGETMLVDTGDYRNDGEHVLDYLRARNVTRIDYLVSSHNDADHIGGLAEVITYYETEADGVGAVYEQGLAAATLTYSDYLDAVEAHNVTVYATTAGAAIPFAGVNVSVYGPPEGYLANGARNENSVVLELGYGETSILLPGDAGEPEERYLLDAYGDRLNATVLKVGHHGSDSSTTPPFLDAVSPRVAVISSAYDSQYGHPHQIVLASLADRDVPTFWTATHGTVVMESDGARVTVSSQRAAPTDPLDLRNATEVPPEESGGVEARLTVQVAENATNATEKSGDQAEMIDEVWPRTLDTGSSARGWVA